MPKIASTSCFSQPSSSYRPVNCVVNTNGRLENDSEDVTSPRSEKRSVMFHSASTPNCGESLRYSRSTSASASPSITILKSKSTTPALNPTSTRSSPPGPSPHPSLNRYPARYQSIFSSVSTNVP